MKWRALSALVMGAVVWSGCDKIPFLNKQAEEAPATSEVTPAEAAPAETAATETTAAEAQAEAPPPADAMPQPAAPSVTPRFASAEDEIPWFPTDTGTVAPGMSIAEVIALWGEPVNERTTPGWTFLFFRNGCERRCGTYDLVIFEDGQVVDAVVRGPGHYYSGTSSSPIDRAPEFTPPTGADTLRGIG